VIYDKILMRKPWGGANSTIRYQLLGSGSSQHLVIQWNNVSFFNDSPRTGGLTFQTVLGVDGSVRFNYLDLTTGNNGGVHDEGHSVTVGLKAAGAQGVNRVLAAFNNGPNTFVGSGESTLFRPLKGFPDYYSFSLDAGQTSTIAVTGQAAGSLNLNLQLRNSSDLILANGLPSTNLTRVISNFTAPSAGTYYLRVAGDPAVPYSLLVIRDAAFDTEPNNSFATARSLGSTQGALGAVAENNLPYTASAVPFGFEDIGATGTIITGLTGADDSSFSIPIGFNFSFFGVNNTSVFVSSNGLMTFGGGDNSFTNADLSSLPSLATIAPYWDDMIITGGAQGLRIKMGVFQHVQQVVRVEGCFHPFGFGAVRDGLVLPQ
jgi:hypothetical protein